MRPHADLFNTIAGRDNVAVAAEAWDRMNQALYDRSYRILIEDMCSSCENGEQCQDLCFPFAQSHFALQHELWRGIASMC